MNLNRSIIVLDKYRKKRESNYWIVIFSSFVVLELYISLKKQLIKIAGYNVFLNCELKQVRSDRGWNRRCAAVCEMYIYKQCTAWKLQIKKKMFNKCMLKVSQIFNLMKKKKFCFDN